MTVLIAGAGPTGLTLALDLARRGVAVRLIDKAPAPSDKSKAIVLHSRTLEVLEALEVAHELVARGLKAHGASLYAGGKRVIHVGFDELESPFPYVLCLPQTDTEEVLRAAASRAGVRIERGVELVGLTQDRDGVQVRLRTGNGEEALVTPFVVGCDGAHSTVRKAVGLPFEGAPYEQRFVLADGQLATSLPEDEVSTFLSEEGPLILVPLGFSRWRVIGTIAREPTESEPTLDELQRLLDERVQPGSAHLSDPRWLAYFRIHHRLVPTYRSGRVLVAGDAAHVHSPAGGQGMNVGIQDARNLAWKLALVLRGQAGEHLLDSYTAERRSVAEGVVSGTDLATRVATLRNPLGRALRDHVGSVLVGFDVVQARIMRNATGVALSYRRSPIVAEDRPGVLGARLRHDPGAETPSFLDWLDFGGAPRPGDRAPDETVTDARTGLPVRILELLRDPRHHLLLFDGRAGTPEGYQHLIRIGDELTRRWRTLVAVHLVVPYAERPAALPWDESLLLDAEGRLHARYGAGSECLYLIRPDGYVGYRSQPADRERLMGYLERLFSV